MLDVKSIGIKMASFSGSLKSNLRTRISHGIEKANMDIRKGNKAQGILEYGLIIALVSLAVLGAVQLLKNSVGTQLNKAATDIQNQSK